MTLERPDTDAIDHLAALDEDMSSIGRDMEHMGRLATLGVMAAGIAHEVNNILTPVTAYAQLALSHPDDAELRRKALEKAVAGVEAASTIIRAMLGFAAEDDTAEGQASVRATVAAAIDCLARDPAKDRIELTVDAPADLVARMRPIALQQVLLNLILNATQALASEGGRIEITARADGDDAVITVADDGPGIPDTIRERLFRAFATTGVRSQPDAPTETDRRAGGTGLGLAICRQLVSDAGGSIDVDSTPGAGTTFCIRLPRYDRSTADEKTALSTVDR